MMFIINVNFYKHWLPCSTFKSFLNIQKITLNTLEYSNIQFWSSKIILIFVFRVLEFSLELK